MKLYRNHVLAALLLLGIGVAGATAAWPLPEAASEPSPKAAAAGDVTTDDDGACDEVVGESEDAASCSAGGWSYDGCCSSANLTRWKKGSSRKCCGRCFMP